VAWGDEFERVAQPLASLVCQQGPSLGKVSVITVSGSAGLVQKLKFWCEVADPVCALPDRCCQRTPDPRVASIHPHVAVRFVKQ
jgi:hypothetical protein